MAKVGARMFNAPWLYWEGKEPGGLGQLTSGWFGIHISYRPFDDVAQVHSTPGEKDGDSTWPERTSLTRRDGLYRRNGPAKDRTLARKLGFSFHFLKIVCGTYHQQTHYVTHTHTETTSQRTFCTCIWAKPWERRWGDSTKNFPCWFFSFLLAEYLVLLRSSPPCPQPQPFSIPIATFGFPILKVSSTLSFSLFNGLWPYFSPHIIEESLCCSVSYYFVIAFSSSRRCAPARCVTLQAIASPTYRNLFSSSSSSYFLLSAVYGRMNRFVLLVSNWDWKVSNNGPRRTNRSLRQHAGRRSIKDRNKGKIG